MSHNVPCVTARQAVSEYFTAGPSSCEGGGCYGQAGQLWCGEDKANDVAVVCAKTQDSPVGATLVALYKHEAIPCVTHSVRADGTSIGPVAIVENGWPHTDPSWCGRAEILATTLVRAFYEHRERAPRQLHVQGRRYAISQRYGTSSEDDHYGDELVVLTARSGGFTVHIYLDA